MLLDFAVKGVSKKQLRNKLAGKLVEENALLCERIALLEKRGQFLSQENAFLRQKVDLLVRRVFGVSSEKLDPSQLDLLLLQAENTPGKPAASSRWRRLNLNRRRVRRPNVGGNAGRKTCWWSNR
ncbi:MAG: transposase [Verrucomicrobiota bacterium]